MRDPVARGRRRNPHSTGQAKRDLCCSTKPAISRGRLDPRPTATWSRPDDVAAREVEAEASVSLRRSAVAGGVASHRAV
jgi:hypothetical protein